jgi:hypothetical protein
LSVQTTLDTLPGTYVITVTATGGSVTRSATYELTILPYDFSISLSDPSATVYQGGLVSTDITLTLLGGTNENVALSISGLVPGANCSLSQGSGLLPYTANLTVEMSLVAPTGTYAFTITGSGPYVDGIQMAHNATWSVTIKPFELTFNSSQVQNVTVNGAVLRNPDGSFYPGDAFLVSFNASVPGGLPSGYALIVNATCNSTLLTMSVVNESIGWRSTSAVGWFMFSVPQEAPFGFGNVSLFEEVLNETSGLPFRLINGSAVPFTVVNYDPHVDSFAYMEYNNLSSTAYERPFVVLVSYGGNDPGFNYTGDLNTDPITAPNDTLERFIVTNFTYQVMGWNATFSMTGSGLVNDLLYNQFPGLDIGTSLMNNSAQTVLIWPDRLAKYYFSSNATDMGSYLTNQGMMYYNVSVFAWYDGIRNATDPVFNCSYFYEPIYYNGYLIFDLSGNANPADDNVSVMSYNPSPLDPYLIGEAEGVFGNDSQAVADFQLDLYPANATTVLQPVEASNGVYVFLVNQTNLATYEAYGQPYYVISITGKDVPGGNFTYTVYSPFSLFQLSNEYLQTSPFQNFTGYYIGPDEWLVTIPLNFSPSYTPAEQEPYVTYAPDGSTPVYFPTAEPGNLTQEYMWIWGTNTTVPANFRGGDVTVTSLEPLAGGEYSVFLNMTSPETGGITNVMVVSDEGALLDNVSLLNLGSDSWPSLISFAPAGYFGYYAIDTPVYDTQNCITVYVTNAWGATWAAVNATTGQSELQVTPPPPPSLPSWPQVLTTVLVLSLVGFYLLRRHAIRRR